MDLTPRNVVGEALSPSDLHHAAVAVWKAAIGKALNNAARRLAIIAAGAGGVQWAGAGAAALLEAPGHSVLPGSRLTLNNAATSAPPQVFACVGTSSQVGLALLVFATAGAAASLERAHGDGCKTGWGGLLGNKGSVTWRAELSHAKLREAGIAVPPPLPQLPPQSPEMGSTGAAAAAAATTTTLCFVASHFASGRENVDQRNACYAAAIDPWHLAVWVPPPPRRAPAIGASHGVRAPQAPSAAPSVAPSGSATLGALGAEKGAAAGRYTRSSSGGGAQDAGASEGGDPWCPSRGGSESSLSGGGVGGGGGIGGRASNPSASSAGATASTVLAKAASKAAATASFAVTKAGAAATNAKYFAREYTAAAENRLFTSGDPQQWPFTGSVFSSTTFRAELADAVSGGIVNLGGALGGAMHGGKAALGRAAQSAQHSATKHPHACPSALGVLDHELVIWCGDLNYGLVASEDAAEVRDGLAFLAASASDVAAAGHRAADAATLAAAAGAALWCGAGGGDECRAALDELAVGSVLGSGGGHGSGGGQGGGGRGGGASSRALPWAAADQLTQERAAGRAFGGFCEAPLGFLPTCVNASRNAPPQRCARCRHPPAQRSPLWITS